MLARSLPCEENWRAKRPKGPRIFARIATTRETPFSYLSAERFPKAKKLFQNGISSSVMVSLAGACDSSCSGAR